MIKVILLMKIVRRNGYNVTSAFRPMRLLLRADSTL